ncbi:type II secretion system protein [Halobacillus sp. B23F22_1]|uniref:type II secretion system protein n=1 Tax=Halobacillus sp. B23F22_1 TaxID=3459514 RepID=UPI00373DFC24
MNNNGFTLVEVISAFSVLMIAALLITPLLMEMRTAQHSLSVKRIALVTLQNKLHDYSTHSSIEDVNESIDEVYYTFNVYPDYREGCAEWKNMQNEEEKECLYAPL